MGEANAVPCQAVECRRIDRPPVASQVVGPQRVDADQEDSLGGNEARAVESLPAADRVRGEPDSQKARGRADVHDGTLGTSIGNLDTVA